MKRLITIVLFFVPLFLMAQNLKPYTTGLVSGKPMEELKTELKTQLVENGFTVLGEYAPAKDSERYLFVVTHDDLLKGVKQLGGLSGFASTLRVALTKEDGKISVSYTTPEYWGTAYYRNDYDKVKANYISFDKNIKTVLKNMGATTFKMFGSEKGVSSKDLKKYKYMMGMPEFDKTQVLATFSSFDEAVSKLDAKLKAGNVNVKEVYSYEIEGKKLKLYGVALGGEKGEEHFLPIIDISNPKHTAFLPYEFLLIDNEVHMLHGRYRIALAFPDLTMGTFTKIMSSPGDIKDLIESVVK